MNRRFACLCLVASLCLAVVPSLCAQSVSELLNAVQERKLALLQRDAILAELVREAEIANSGSATTEEDPVEVSELVDWGSGLSRFPSQSEVGARSLKQLLGALNRASREVDILKSSYLNFSPDQPDQLPDPDDTLAELPSVGDFNEGNYPEKIKQLASNVRALRALRWPAQYNKYTIRSGRSASDEEPDLPASVRPNIPFVEGADSYETYSELAPGYGTPLYDWSGGGGSGGVGSSLQGKTTYTRVLGACGILCRVDSTSANYREITTGQLFLYKRLMIDSEAFVENASGYSATALPRTYAAKLSNGSGTLSLGSMSLVVASDSASLASTSNSTLISQGQIPSLSWAGSWAGESPNQYFVFEGVPPPAGLSSSSGTYPSGRFEVEGFCICLPGFASMSGESASRLLGAAGGRPGEVDAPLDADIVRINLGRGLTDRSQTASLGTRMDGFGSPVFSGSAEAFRLIYETRESEFPACLVPERLDYDIEDEFDETEIENTGWETKREYVLAWFKPRLRQIYGTDVVVDITYNGDYSKTLKFYWASQVSPPSNSTYLPVAPGATAFKTVVITNPNVSSSFPSSVNELSAQDDNVFWTVVKTEGGFQVKYGDSAGGDNLLTRTLSLPSSTTVVESTTHKGVTVTENTTYFHLENDDTEPPNFHRFSRLPVATSITQGARQISFQYTSYPIPQSPDNLPLFDQTPRPLVSQMSCSGDSTWSMNGAQTVWTAEGALVSTSQKVSGQLFSKTYQWSGHACDISSKLGGPLDGTSYASTSVLYSDDLLAQTFTVDEQSAGAVEYGSGTDPAPWLLQETSRPGGYSATTSITPGQSSTIISQAEGWGPSLTSGTVSTTTLNRWGGLVAHVVAHTTPSGSVTTSSSTGSLHTPWGEPTRLTGLRGEQQNVTYTTNGRQWGLPATWTSPTGVSGSVGSYDPFFRPNTLSTGFKNLNMDYNNPLQSKTTVVGEGDIIADRNVFGDVTATSDSRPGGATTNLTPGGATMMINNRSVSLDLSPSREVLGQGSGLGSRGAIQTYTVEEDKLCLLTTHRNQASASHFTSKTFYDGQGRIVKVTRPGADGPDANETWQYNDTNRTVIHTPVTSPSSVSVKSELSEDGATLTIADIGKSLSSGDDDGTQTRTTRSVSSGSLVVTKELWNDSSGPAHWVQLSQSKYAPATGASQFTPWDLTAAATTSTTPAPSDDMTTSGGGGSNNDQQSVQLLDGLTKSLTGRLRGVPFVLDDWKHEGDRLVWVKGTVGGIGTGVEWDEQSRIARVYGPGFDRSYDYPADTGYTVNVEDVGQGVNQTFTSSAVGDFTGRSGDGMLPLAASTSDLSGGRTETTLNENLTVRAAADGSLLRKEYPGITENLGRYPDGTLSSFGAGPEAGSREYNAANRTWSTEYGSDTDTVKMYKVGLPQFVSGPAGDEREFQWENFQFKSERHVGGTWSGALVEQDYDGKGHASSSEVSPPTGTSVTFDTTPDQYGRPATVAGLSGFLGFSGVSGFSGDYDYYPDGQFKQFSRGPLTTTWTYDAEGRVDTVTTVNTSGPGFAYDHNFNSKNLRTSRLASGAGSSWTGLYYDQAHQLKGAAGFDYNYDSRGNRTAGGGGAEIWTVNGLDQATGRTLGQRRYGVTGSVAPGATVRVKHPGAPNGEVVPVDPVTGAYSASWIATSSGSGVERVEMLVRGTLAGAGTSGTDAVADKLVWAVVPAASEVLAYDGAGRLVGDSLWTYTWDARGKLTGMTRKTGTFTEPSIASEELSFRYDAEGRRVRKLHTVTYQNATTKMSESKLLWNGWLPAMEDRTLDGVAQPRRWFVWGRDLSDDWSGAGGIGGLAAIIEEGGRTLLPVDDGLGNIMAVVNAADGSVVATYDYGPYGEPLGQSGDVSACPFRYQSKYLDVETGLSYFGYRYYSAKLGRWISRDPLGESGGFNLYGYCGNDPVNRWDYLGLKEAAPFILRWLPGYVLEFLGYDSEQSIEEEIYQAKERDRNEVLNEASSVTIGDSNWKPKEDGIAKGLYQSFVVPVVDGHLRAGLTGDPRYVLPEIPVSVSQAEEMTVRFALHPQEGFIWASSWVLGVEGIRGMSSPSPKVYYQRSQGLTPPKQRAISYYLMYELNFGELLPKKNTTPFYLKESARPGPPASSVPFLRFGAETLYSTPFELSRIRPTDMMNASSFKTTFRDLAAGGLRDPFVVYVMEGGIPYTVYGGNRVHAAKMVPGVADQLIFIRAELPYKGFSGALDLQEGWRQSQKSLRQIEKYFKPKG